MTLRTIDSYEITWTLVLLVAITLYLINLRGARRDSAITQGFGLMKDHGIAALFSFFIRQELIFIGCTLFFMVITVLNYFTVSTRFPSGSDVVNETRLLLGSLLIPAITFVQMGASIHARITRDYLMNGRT